MEHPFPTQRGRLIVFEGPDESGKTTISRMLHERMNRIDAPCIWMSFPGSEIDTLGNEIYKIHHDQRFAEASSLSIQLLHVAAHVDSIETKILPALKNGISVILDRYWWSTFAYAKAAGVGEDIIRKVLEIEEAVWSGQLPDAAFLMIRTPSGVGEQSHDWDCLATIYKELANVESSSYPVQVIYNQFSIESALEAVEINVASLFNEIKN
jgi:thymidylate kinase